MTGYLSLIPAFFGSLGFVLFFSIDRRHLIPASLNGAFAWLIYLLVSRAGGTIFLSSLAGTAFAAVVSEILSRTRKAPSTLFYIGGIIPLVPGSNLYYMVEAFFKGDMERAGAQAYALLWTILGIAVGAAAVLGVVWTIRKARKESKKAGK